MVLFDEAPTEQEATQASFSYVVSMAAVAVGLPLPIINLVASVIFALGSRRAAPFARWHATQALLSQLLLFIVNASLMAWTVRCYLADADFPTLYFVGAGGVVLLNAAEFIGTIQAAIRTRRGEHVRFPLIARITDTLLDSSVP
ncbi:MAG: hypothetical protein RLZZ275_810 [Bacteroidota bacterium]|jgi:uncharacterized membrane protein